MKRSKDQLPSNNDGNNKFESEETYKKIVKDLCEVSIDCESKNKKIAIGEVGIEFVGQINTQTIDGCKKKEGFAIGPSTFELHWKQPPKAVLITKSEYSEKAEKALEDIFDYLTNEKKTKVFVEPKVWNQLKWKNLSTFMVADDEQYDIPTFLSECEVGKCCDPPKGCFQRIKTLQNLHEIIDFVICLGGDGTMLHTASLFQLAVPPILGFNLGSLGFLASFDVEGYKKYIDQVFQGDVYLSPRMRLTCKIRRADGQISEERHQILNELVLDRGPSPFLTNLECYCNNTFITSVQADGIIVATPTGSTAYSMSAGGSICHPNVNCIMLTPICPHTLSFRPILLPDSTILTLRVPDEARGTAWTSFDGKCRQELKKGDAIIVTTSVWPVPLITKVDETSEWFRHLTGSFNWNAREQQKSFK
ncbi:NAD+ kinase [Acrasis kona]|uniref:NAD+ kinase n=1 Tax=Acrasis kona TaxID=1008807 RepID=A0AAW2Z1X9_9EUKA